MRIGSQQMANYLRRNIYSTVAALVAAVVLAACSASSESASVTPSTEDLMEQLDSTISPSTEVCDTSVLSVRTDLSAEANKVSDVSIDLAAAESTIVDLQDTPMWVVPYEAGESWYVAFTSGEAVIVTDDGAVEPIGGTGLEPPEVLLGEGAVREVVSAWREQSLFDNPLPDTRIAKDGDTWVALVEPTDRYAHAVIGDDLEAAAIQVLDVCAETSTLIEIDAPDVIEGVSPILADLDGDAEVEIIVTVSNADVGARLVAYSLEGDLVGESDPIGQGNRWRNQMGVARIGPNGEVELVSLRLPHINGVVEFFSLESGRLVQTAELEGFTSHQIFSQNLDLGVIFDATGSGEPNVVVPTQSRESLAIIGRTQSGAEIVDSLEVPGRVFSNLAVDESSERFAVGTESNQLVIWNT